jgi:cation-transporting ATPase G
VVLIHEVAEVVVIANGVRAGRAQSLAPQAVGPAQALPAPAEVSAGSRLSR